MSLHHIIDARGLEPPEPFEKAMEAVADLLPGESVTLVLDRMPHPLFRVLERDGYRYSPLIRDDGSVEILIEHP